MSFGLMMGLVRKVRVDAKEMRTHWLLTELGH